MKAERHQTCNVTSTDQHSQQFLESDLSFEERVAGPIIQCYRRWSHSQKNEEDQNKL